jgi:hypothetical protein
MNGSRRGNEPSQVEGSANAASRDALAREGERQAALVATLLGRGPPEAPLGSVPGTSPAAQRIAAGLAVYRANAAALAARALGAAFPTVRALVGAATFERLAHDHWRAAPPTRGDIGEWGEGFAAWLEAQAPLAAWPFLGDVARLDHAVHACERAADATFDAASLGLLEASEPGHLRLRFHPGTQVIRSRWPVATLHAAHRGDAEPDAESLRAAVAAGRGECVLVARDGWRAALHPLDDADARVAAALLSGMALGPALEAAGPDFDFAAWLAQALRGGWLQGVVLEGPLAGNRA